MRRCLVAGSFLLAASTGLAAPKPGRHDVELCVATSPNAAASCGPARAEVRSGGAIDVRVADVVYALHLRSSQLNVSTKQERVQIDAFDAPYEWIGETLRFVDVDKNVRYEVRFEAGRRARP